MTDNAKSWQNHDIHLWMTEEPKQMQEQDRVTAAFWNEKGCAKITVGQQHGNGACQNRHGQQ